MYAQMKIWWDKICSVMLLMILFSSFMSGDAVMAASIDDTLQNSMVGENSVHELTVNLNSSVIIHNGSIKFDFDNSFGFGGLTVTDINVIGGDVIWQVALINNIDNTILIPYLGDLDGSDGQIVLVVGGLNLISNPVMIGSNSVTFGSYNSSDGSGEPVESIQTLVAIMKGVTVNATIPESIIFNVNGMPIGTDVNGETSDVATLSTAIDFGQTYGAAELVAAQELTVLTNASNGFNVTVQYNHPLRNGIYDIPDWLGTNLFPTSWSPPSGAQKGYFGYTTNDASLSVLPIDRFRLNKWAGLWALPEEVMYNNSPADGVTQNIGRVNVGYRLEVTDWQESGTYSNTVTYVCTPFY
jgi:hypothetical protein